MTVHWRVPYTPTVQMDFVRYETSILGGIRFGMG